jgi:uncharacterized protein (DUF2132 family)
MSTDMSTNESTSMNTPAPRSLNGITLEKILEQLVAYYGWEQMGQMIDINCFKSDPSIKSSLKFLRKTPWARAKVEELYLGMPG